MVPIDDVIMEEDDSKSSDEDMIVGVELDVEEASVFPVKRIGGIKGILHKLWNCKIMERE